WRRDVWGPERPLQLWFAQHLALCGAGAGLESPVWLDVPGCAKLWAQRHELPVFAALGGFLRDFRIWPQGGGSVQGETGMKLGTLAGMSALLFAELAVLGAAPAKTETPEQESVYAELTKAPEKYRNRTNPLANDRDAAAAGGVLFKEHCED